MFDSLTINCEVCTVIGYWHVSCDIIRHILIFRSQAIALALR